MSKKKQKTSEVDSLISSGLEKFGFGDFKGAMEDWHSVLQIDPSNKTAGEYIALATEEMQDGCVERQSANACHQVYSVPSEAELKKSGSHRDIDHSNKAPVVEERVVVTRQFFQNRQDKEEMDDVFSTSLGLGEHQPVEESQLLEIESTNVGVGVELDFEDKEDSYGSFNMNVPKTVVEKKPEAFDKAWIDNKQPGGSNIYEIMYERVKRLHGTYKNGSDEFIEKAVSFSKEAALQNDFRWAVCVDDYFEQTFSDQRNKIEQYDSFSKELLAIQKSYLGDSSRYVKKNPINTSLDPKSAFLLSRIDGMLSVDDLLDVSGMPKNETLRLLARLLFRRVVEYS